MHTLRPSVSGILFSALLLVLAPRIGGAQAITTGTIEALATDAQSGVLPGATVTLRDKDRGTRLTQTTDREGRVRFLAVPIGVYELRAELQGFSAGAFSAVRVNPGSHQTFTFELEVGAMQETVQVSAEAPLINTNTAQESTTLDGRYLESVPLVTRNMTELPTIFPGVSYNRGARLAYQHFNVRGGEREDNIYLLDGGSLNRGGGRAGILVAPGFIERVEFVPGGFSAEYSGRQSSVINLVSKSGTNTVHGFFSAIAKPNALISNIESGLPNQVRDKPIGTTGFVESSVGGPLRQNRLGYFTGVQYNRDEQGTILARDPEPRQVTVVPAHAKLSFQQNDANRWELTAHMGPFSDVNQQLTTEIAPESDSRQDITTWSTVLRQTHLMGSTSVVETSVHAFYMDFLSGKPVTSGTPSTPFVRYFDTTLGHLFTRGPSANVSGVDDELRLTLSSKYTKNAGPHTIKIGGEWVETSGKEPRMRTVPVFTDLRARPGGGPVTRQDPFSVEGSLRDRRVGLFAQDTWAPTGNLTVDAGLRAEWQDRASNHTTLSPRFGLTLDPNGGGRSKVFANFGIYYSEVFQTIFDFADSRVTDITYTVTNPDANLVGRDAVRSVQQFRLADDIRNPYIIHFAAGYERLLARDLKGSATFVRRRGRHQPSGRSDRVSPIEVIQIQATEGRLEYTGLELTLQKALSNRVEGLVSYTLSKVDNNAPGQLSPVQQQFSYGPADYDQRHTLTGSSTVMLPADVRFTGLYRFATGRPYAITNDDPTIFAAFVDRQGNITGRNQERLPSGWTFDFNVARDFPVRKATIRALLQVLNATNRVNVLTVSTSLASAGQPTTIEVSRQIQFGVEVRF